jgi:hypothetical protein
MSLLSTSIGAGLIAMGPRTPGAIARIWADREAPAPIRQNTLKREAAHVGSLTILPAVLTPVMSRVMVKMTGPTSFWAKGVGLAALTATTAATLVEVGTRTLWPTQDWGRILGRMNVGARPVDTKVDEDFDDDDDDTHGPATKASSLSFSKASYNPPIQSASPPLQSFTPSVSRFNFQV